MSVGYELSGGSGALVRWARLLTMIAKRPETKKDIGRGRLPNSLGERERNKERDQLRIIIKGLACRESYET